MKTLKKISNSLLVGVALAMVACGQPAGQMPPKSYKTMTVQTGDRSVSSQYTASIKGRQFVEIRPQVAGVITNILINEGASVRKGQTLFIIDQVPYKAALETAQANVKSAQAQVATAQLNADSRQELFNAKVVSDYDLQTAKNQLLTAQAALAQAKAQEVNARNNLSYTEVKSPVDGVASMLPYRIGTLVSSAIQEPLVTVADDSQMNAYFSMTEAQVLGMSRKGTSIDSMPEVRLILNDGTEYTTAGKIDAISGTIDSRTGAVQVRAIFANPTKMLRNGGSGRVVIDTQRKDAIIIPKIATFELQNKVFVYKVVDGKATAAPVEVFMLNNGTEYIVENGIAVGDVIIAEGAGLVREGTPIQPQQTAQTQEQPSQEEQK